MPQLLSAFANFYLVHPQQPLSYLERLIQSELPTLKNSQGEDKIPAVHFRAEDSQRMYISKPLLFSHGYLTRKLCLMSNDNHELLTYTLWFHQSFQVNSADFKVSTEDEMKPKTETPDEAEGYDGGDLEETQFDGRTEKTGKLRPKSAQEATSQSLGDGSVESYSGLGHEGSGESQGKFVRWSPSTEIGDFIRDAARGKEFAIEIEGAPKEIRIGVPSFNDRTYYLRTRLRKTSRKILDMTTIKRECDLAAHKGAQRVATGGAGLLVGYWYVVYRLTFETDLGWDTMEPVTVSRIYMRSPRVLADCS